MEKRDIILDAIECRTPERIPSLCLGANYDFMEQYFSEIGMSYDIYSQYRKDGITPYILHPARVADKLDNDIEKSIAWLHDSVEDTSITLHDLEEIFPNEITDIVDILTHKKEEFYDSYINRVSKNVIATKIKILDIEDNLNDVPSNWQTMKYKSALKVLKKPI